MEWIRSLLVMLLLSRAIYTDVKKGIIENKCMSAGMFTGLLWSAANGGVLCLLESCRIVLLLLVALYVLFAVKGLGAGDIKLFLALGTFFQEAAIGIVVISFLVAAGMIVVKMTIRYLQKKKVYVRGETMNFSIPIGIATMLVIWKG